MITLRNAFFILLILSGFRSLAQLDAPDSVFMIDELIIHGDRLEEYAIGVSVQEFDSSKLTIYQSRDLANLLANESGVTIKSYGVGGLATPSIRGGGSNHTPILWNGINLQNSMNGNASLSLIPVSFFDHVEVQYGGASTLFGSGVVSGAIHINNSTFSQQKDHLKLNLGIGSFGERLGFIDFKNANGKWEYNLKTFYRHAENDFPYTNIAKFGRPRETQTNAGFKVIGITQTNEIALSEYGKLSTHVWLNYYDKDLQTLMIQDTSQSHQEDNSVRVMINYANTRKNCFNIKSAFLYDELLYTNPALIDPSSRHFTKSLINEAEKSYFIGTKNKINIGVNYTYEEANSNDLVNNSIRNRISIFGNWRTNDLILNRLNTAINVRQEMVDGDIIPLVASAGFDYLINDHWLFKGNISKNYRIPTFNDLYWRNDIYSVGNPNLLPESGYNVDAGFKQFLYTNNLSITLNQDLYWTRTKNWIVWLPNKDGQWKPENKEIGKSYGAEISYKIDAKINRFGIMVDGFFKYSKATLSEKEQPDIEKVAWYEPKFSYRGSFGFSIKNYSLTYNHSFYSERNYDSNHTLPSYHLGNINFGYHQTIQKNLMNISLNINNVWNTEYQVIAWYAMPPTHYQLNVSYQFNL